MGNTAIKGLITFVPWNIVRIITIIGVLRRIMSENFRNRIMS